MQFKDIIGQYVLINHLTQIADSGRVSHAQLFLGKNGYGSLALATAYAQYLNCENRQHYHVSDPTKELIADSCGECPNCKKYQALVHSDLHMVFPNITAGSSDTTSAELFIEEFRKHMLETNMYTSYENWISCITSDQKQGIIREKDAANMVQILSMKTYEAPYKTLLIWMPEKMNNPAANEILKILEEPTDRTIIFLISDNREAILPTILSRTQLIPVPRIDNESLLTAIQKKYNITGHESEVVSAAEGDYIAATRYLSADNPDHEYAHLFVEWMRKLFKLNMAPLSAWVDNIYNWKNRDKQKQFLSYSQEALRACFLKTTSGLILAHRMQFSDAKFNEKFPFMITSNNIERINQAFDEAIMAIDRNGYAKLVFMQLSFTLSVLLKKA